MEELEDFKYEFNFRHGYVFPNTKVPYMLYIGYLYLHQLSVQDLINEADKKNIISIIENLLEDDEYLYENNGSFELKIKDNDEEVIDYIKFLLTNSLVMTKNLRRENNLIKWEIDDKN